MNRPPSADTQATLLLTAPLLLGRPARNGASPLSGAEFRALRRRLREAGLRPADLLDSDPWDRLGTPADRAEPARLTALLARGMLLAQALDRWAARGIWVAGPGDAEYPQRLCDRLGDESPVVLYGCGDPQLLGGGGLAVVGSRNADEFVLEYAAAAGRLTARAGVPLVSGGARGVDRAAMGGSLEAGGLAVGVLADTLERGVVQREQRDLIMEGRLTLVSPYDPAAGFNVGNAMGRNKVVYALADAALVVQSDWKKGGTWAGAVEQLRRARGPVYLRSEGPAARGLDELKGLGARPWPNPSAPRELLNLLGADVQGAPSAPALPLDPPSEAPPAEASAVSGGDADEIFAAARSVLLRALRTPSQEGELASALHLTRDQTRAWLRRLADEGVVERRGRPARYSLRRPTLFDAP